MIRKLTGKGQESLEYVIKKINELEQVIDIEILQNSHAMDIRIVALEERSKNMYERVDRITEEVKEIKEEIKEVVSSTKNVENLLTQHILEDSRDKLKVLIGIITLFITIIGTAIVESVVK